MNIKHGIGSEIHSFHLGRAGVPGIKNSAELLGLVEQLIPECITYLDTLPSILAQIYDILGLRSSIAGASDSVEDGSLAADSSGSWVRIPKISNSKTGWTAGDSAIIPEFVAGANQDLADLAKRQENKGQYT